MYIFNVKHHLYLVGFSYPSRSTDWSSNYHKAVGFGDKSIALAVIDFLVDVFYYDPNDLVIDPIDEDIAQLP